MTSLRELLLSHFGESFPVGSGSAKRDDPLVVTELRDYASIEYAVAQWLLDGDEYELEVQQLHRNGAQSIDELVYATKPMGSKEWTETRRFFFDITAGFSRLGRR